MPDMSEWIKDRDRTLLALSRKLCSIPVGARQPVDTLRGVAKPGIELQRPLEFALCPPNPNLGPDEANTITASVNVSSISSARRRCSAWKDRRLSRSGRTHGQAGVAMANPGSF